MYLCEILTESGNSGRFFHGINVSNLNFHPLILESADTTKVQRIYNGNILDGISEHLKGIGEGLKGNFQNLNDAEKQGTNTVLEYLQSLEKTIGAKLESMEKKANDKLTKLQEGMQA